MHCSPHTSLCHSSIPWLLSHHNPWLAPESYFSPFFLGTLCLCEKCHWGLPIPAGKEERKQQKESPEWWWWWLSVWFSDLICLYSSDFLLIPGRLVLLLPMEHSRLQMITSRHSNRKLLLGSILGLFSVYSCKNKITSPSSFWHKRQPSNKHFQEMHLVLQFIYNRH